MGRSEGRGRQRGEERRKDEGKNEKERGTKRRSGLSPSKKIPEAHYQQAHASIYY